MGLAGWKMFSDEIIKNISGVFVNNYSNFLLWVNLEVTKKQFIIFSGRSVMFVCFQDQLRLVSVSKGQDLKYVLLRLQKAVARIEEALKVRKFY